MFPINFILTSKHLTTSILAKRRRPNPARTQAGIVVSILSTVTIIPKCALRHCRYSGVIFSVESVIEIPILEQYSCKVRQVSDIPTHF
jgi:hypothetical protein